MAIAVATGINNGAIKMRAETIGDKIHLDMPMNDQSTENKLGKHITS